MLTLSFVVVIAASAATIEIRDPFDPSFSVCASAFVNDCAFDFGDVPVGQSRIFSFSVVNGSNGDLTLAAFVLDGSPRFTIEGPVPPIVNGGASVVLRVRFTPTLAAPESATATLTSDAVNAPSIAIAFAGDGIGGSAPSITVAQATCDFGVVAPGEAAACARRRNREVDWRACSNAAACSRCSR